MHSVAIFDARHASKFRERIMITAKTISAKDAAREVIDALPGDASWDEVMYRIYVRQAIEAGLRDADAGNLVDVSEVRKKFGLPE
jgi:predicted transcriptional regulator